jgi:hypothetical protein
MDLSQRHPSTRQVAMWFTFKHLEEPAQSASKQCSHLAERMLADLPDSPELTAGLRKLLEAKDCFVRATIEANL